MRVTISLCDCILLKGLSSKSCPRLVRKLKANSFELYILSKRVVHYVRMCKSCCIGKRQRPNVFRVLFELCRVSKFQNSSGAAVAVPCMLMTATLVLLLAAFQRPECYISLISATIYLVILLHWKLICSSFEDISEGNNKHTVCITMHPVMNWSHLCKMRLPP